MYEPMMIDSNHGNFRQFLLYFNLSYNKENSYIIFLTKVSINLSKNNMSKKH
jgi:hypothetical protein